MSLTYHNYSQDNSIAVDIETYDPLLTEKGNGVYRKDGYILGVSLSNGGLSEYYSFDHPDTTAIEKEKNEKYIKTQLESRNTKIFAHGIYDLDWLVNWKGWKVNGQLEDIQIAEPLLNEYRRTYNLNILAEDYLGQGKAYDGILEYAVSHGLMKAGSSENPVKHLYQMPKSIGEVYASEDARLTYKVFFEQLRVLEEQDLIGIYRLEAQLIPLLLQMRRSGVRLNKDKLYKTGLELSDIQFDLQEELNEFSGFIMNVNSNKDLEKLFEKENIPITYNAPTDRMLLDGKILGNPSFSKPVLETTAHPIVKKILELRHISTLLSLFIHSYPEYIVGDRLHCQFNQLRSDNFGTVSGRFSSSNPNLQQVSNKEEEDHIHSDSEILNGLIIRKLFIPEEDHHWLKMDWSQIEYRIIAHYAIGEGSELIRRRYNEDPNVDYHDEIGEMVGLTSRKTVKNLNFGTAYSMGIATMAKKFNMELEEAQNIYKMYHAKVPFVRETSRRVINKSKRVGFIKSILGRRARMPSSKKAYVMFNRLIQSSAADIMKKAMVDAYNAGIFEVLIPHITVHDELDSSMPKTQEGEEAGKELKNIMESCIKLKVPIKVDAEIGNNWGELEDWNV